MGFRQFFRDGLPIGKLIKKTTDLDEETEAQVEQYVDVGMARVLDNSITLIEALLGALRAVRDKD